ncbi:MAG: arsenate reductase ArsC [Actinomycetota bacterium]|nr:arsenate reductase ArsC [Actinomycetota bacterium]
MKIRPASDDGALDAIVEVLSREFAGTFSRGTVARIVQDTAARWRDAPITPFVPTFTHRFARERLRAVALLGGGHVSKEVPQVLFVCVQNAGRSQMAAALLAHHARGRVGARSAGSAPAPQIYYQVLKAMDEVKIHLAEEFPKPLTHQMVRAADVLITMACGDVCPIYPDVRYLNWDLPDPAEKELEEVRAVRNEIDARVREFLTELLEG